MTQINETTDARIMSASEDMMPAVQNSFDTDNDPAKLQDSDEISATAFIDTAKEKVQLDIEDAPFLQDDPEEEEEKPTKRSGAKGKEKATEEKTSTTSSAKKKKIILLALASLLLIILSIVGFFAYQSFMTPGHVMQNFITIPSPPEDEHALFYETTLEPFWVDLNNPDSGAKFLVGKFILRMENQDIQNELNLNRKKIRDAIYYYLASVDPDFLLDVKHREEVRKGIIDIVNPYLVSGQISTVYFDSFLMK